jgi:hypothetical protein
VWSTPFRSSFGQGLALPVSSQARGAFLEAGYDVLRLLAPKELQSLTAFVRGEYVDTQADVPAGFEAKLAFHRYSALAGLVYRPIPQIALAGSFAWALLAGWALLAFGILAIIVLTLVLMWGPERWHAFIASTEGIGPIRPVPSPRRRYPSRRRKATSPRAGRATPRRARGAARSRLAGRPDRLHPPARLRHERRAVQEARLGHVARKPLTAARRDVPHPPRREGARERRSRFVEGGGSLVRTMSDPRGSKAGCLVHPVRLET